jgi:pimeloyl-ACP methyl ester carboxylesterase
MPPRITSVKIGDVNIKLHRAGSGRKVLFLHGAGGLAQWLPFFDSLAGKFELLVTEHPGFGGSDDPKWIRNVPDIAMFYLDFLETMGLGDLHLIGNSLGGWIAAELAIRDRSRLKSLTLLAPAGLRVNGVPSGDTFIWNPEENARNLFLDQSFADRLLSIEPSEEQIDVMLKNRYTVTKLGWQPRWFNPDLEKWLHRIKLPAHIVWGDSDKVMPPAYAEKWRQGLPNARLTMVEKCGHLPHVEQATLVSRGVIDFLDQVPA